MLSNGEEVGKTKDMRTSTNYNNHHRLLSTNCVTSTGAKHLTLYHVQSSQKPQEAGAIVYPYLTDE